MIVKVVDGQGGSATIDVTVTVTDVDTEAPDQPAAPTLVEATLNSLKVQWTAPPNTGPPISAYDVRYIRTSEDEADDNNWTVQEEAWKSDIVGDLTYTIGSLDQNTSYDVQVRAKNAEGTGDWSESGVGMTIQNHAPVFAEVSPISVSENSTGAIITVSATDDDADDSITGYGIVADADGSQFSIVAATGVLTFTTAPNYEDPKDVEFTDLNNSDNNNAADNNEYIVVVSATSGEDVRELTVRDTLTITVTDEEEPPDKPAAPQVSASTLNSLTISWDAPTNTGPAISSYDVRYILTNAPDKGDENWTLQEEVWNSDMDTDFAYTISPLSQNTGYDIQVRAENEEGTGAWSDSGVGMTVENQSPTFSEGSSATRSFAENTGSGEGIGTPVAATDNDGGTLVYSLEGDDAGSFDLVTDSGQLETKANVTYDYETKNSYLVIVKVVDGQGGSATIDVTVSVTDVDTEAPDQPAAPTLVEATLNSLKVQWTAPPNTGPPISAYDVRYIPTSEDETDDANWTEVENAWQSSDTPPELTYEMSSLEQNTGYDVQVRAENDEGTGVWSESGVGMTAQNRAPVFADVSPITVSENSTADVVTVSAIDADTEDSITGYGIVDGADGEQFEIMNSGVLTFTTAPNYESPTDVAVTDPESGEDDNEYIVIVTATSGEGARALTARDTITVTVEDVNEAPGVPAAPTLVEATLNSSDGSMDSAAEHGSTY